MYALLLSSSSEKTEGSTRLRLFVYFVVFVYSYTSNPFSRSLCNLVSSFAIRIIAFYFIRIWMGLGAYKKSCTFLKNLFKLRIYFRSVHSFTSKKGLKYEIQWMTTRIIIEILFKILLRPVEWFGNCNWLIAWKIAIKAWFFQILNCRHVTHLTDSFWIQKRDRRLDCKLHDCCRRQLFLSVPRRYAIGIWIS
jgi:hypothetical protein